MISNPIAQVSPLLYNSSYNPGKSILTYVSVYGSGTQVTFNELQAIVNRKITEAIVFGVRCGASCLMIIITWLITQRKRTAIFIINQTSLFLILLHSALYFKYLLSSISSLTYTLTYFPQAVTRNDVHVYGATNIIEVLLVASIEVSLAYQVKIVFSGQSFRKLGHSVLCLSTLLGLSTICMFAYTAIHGIARKYAGKSTPHLAKYFNISTILLASSINLMTLILVIKLILAIRSRRFLGLRQFDTFYILLIVSVHSLVCPSIMFILSYSLPQNRGTDVLVTVATLLVVLSLPFSSMWANARNNVSMGEPATEGTYSPNMNRFYSRDLGKFTDNHSQGIFSPYSEPKVTQGQPVGLASYRDSIRNGAISPSSETTTYDKLANHLAISTEDEKNINVSHGQYSTAGEYSDRTPRQILTELAQNGQYNTSRALPRRFGEGILHDSDEFLGIATPDTVTEAAARRFWLGDAGPKRS